MQHDIVSLKELSKSTLKIVVIKLKLFCINLRIVFYYLHLVGRHCTDWQKKKQ